MSEKVGVKQKISTGVSALKKHWKTPPDGYYVNYKEFLNLALGSGSLSFLSVLITWTTIAINIPMMISYFKVSTGFIPVFFVAASHIEVSLGCLVMFILVQVETFFNTLSVCNMVLNNALVPGMLIGPWMIKKLGK